MLKDLLKEKKISLYKLAQMTKLPYSTLHDLMNNKKKIEDCSVKILKAISDALSITMDEAYNYCRTYRYVDFELFKSNLQHDLKSMGDGRFIKMMIEEDLVNQYWKQSKRLEAIYVLCMLDYVSERNGIPTYNKYDELRDYKLEEEIYPTAVNNKWISKEECKKKAIPVFKEHNIMEVNVDEAV